MDTRNVEGISIKDQLTQKVKDGVPISLGEGFEWLKRLRKRNKETREAHDRKEFRTYHTTEDKDLPDQMGQQKYLVYALSFIREAEPILYKVLILRMRGQSCKQLARFLNTKGWNTTEKKVEHLERQAIECVQAKINYVKKHGIPIFKDPAPRQTPSGIIRAA